MKNPARSLSLVKPRSLSGSIFGTSSRKRGLVTQLLWVLTLVGSICHAEIYQWKDADGKTVFSERPPRDVKATVVKPKVSPASAEAIEKLKAQTAPKKEAGKEKKAAANKPEPTAEEKKANCEKSRQALTKLESSTRLRYKNDEGELAFLPEEQRQANIKTAQKNIAEWCK
jgi:Domain of unknown function (DUF4124)